MAAANALREALNQGISSGNLVDTKIILYSHRDSSGRICRPKALYANGHVLKSVPYFNDLLFGHFAESQSKDFSEEAVDEDEFGEDYGYSSDSDLEDDEDERVSWSKYATKWMVLPFDPLWIFREDGRNLCGRHEEHVERGKVVKIPDMAFVTFQAFLMYLYTGVISFAPFGSRENRRSRSAEIITPSDDEVPRPSPKSIYRLADKYDVPALKALALNHIRSNLGQCDIVEETFSRFTSRHDEIRNTYINKLASDWMKSSTMEAVRARVNKKIDSIAEGGLEHAAGILSVLWKVVNEDGDTATPSNTSPALLSVTSPTRWAAMKIALIKSVRKGVFFDRKYWTRHSRTGGVMKPVYFSSVIMADRARQMNSLVKYLKSRDALVHDLKGDANDDSDCEGNPTGTADETPKEEQGEEDDRPVLVAGSFSAWKFVFFYRCTDKVSFAPLQSQGVKYRKELIRKTTVTTAPPPCSPKTIYVLASSLGIRSLCDIALADIKRKVTLDNVVEELFSQITTSQEKIMEAQCELLVSNVKDPKTIALVEETIRRISDGTSPDSAHALKLWLKKAFELKKEKLPGVLLRCPRDYCTRNKYPDSRQVAGPSAYCRLCLKDSNWGVRLQCSGCGCDIPMFGNRAECGRCARKFI